MDNDGISEQYILQDGVIKIYNGSAVIWESPRTWWIDQFDLADATNDGVSDLSISVWKQGNYGRSQPFWVKENDQSVKNHFFIFNLLDGKIAPIWQSSNLTAPNCEFTLADVDDDGKNELIVIEGTYQDWPNCIGIYTAIWEWNGWGFSNEWRSEQGTFNDLGIEQLGDTTAITTDASHN